MANRNPIIVPFIERSYTPDDAYVCVASAWLYAVIVSLEPSPHQTVKSYVPPTSKGSFIDVSPVEPVLVFVVSHVEVKYVVSTVNVTAVLL